MGDKPAPAISAEAIQKTATMFQKSYPEVNRLLNQSIYVDDIVESVESISHALNLAKDTEHVLLKGGFHVKGWIFGGPADKKKSNPNSTKTRVLGVLWDPETDNVSFDISTPIQQRITRRSVLETVMKIYDPMGLLSPFMVSSKILLRETWELKLA